MSYRILSASWLALCLVGAGATDALASVSGVTYNVLVSPLSDSEADVEDTWTFAEGGVFNTSNSETPGTWTENARRFLSVFETETDTTIGPFTATDSSIGLQIGDRIFGVTFFSFNGATIPTATFTGAAEPE